MRSSSAQTHQLGRQFWTSVRDSFDSLVWQFPTRHNGHLPRSPLPGFSASRTFSVQPAPVRTVARSVRRSSFFNNSNPPLFRQQAHRCGRSTHPNFSNVANRLSPNNVRRSCTSGGLLLLGLSSPSTPAPSTVVATCTATADAALSSRNSNPNPSIGRMPLQAWKFHHYKYPLGGLLAELEDSVKGIRYKSTSSHRSHARAKKTMVQTGPRFRPPASSQYNMSSDAKRGSNGHSKKPKPLPPGHEDESIATSMSKYLQSHLPKIPHRPTKEELLAAATGFWQRSRVRLKWFSIRSMRPWNADEWGAFVSWVMLGHILWILVGTTTFFSLLIFTINTVFAQEELAKWVGDYLTQSAGVTVVFESAIVPRWKDGVITFRNVFVSRRPGQAKSSVKKGSSSSAAAIAAARHSQEAAVDHSEEAVDDGNYTQFDVTINSVDVTLSFIKWWNGKGLLKDVEVRGVRGVIDRTSVIWPTGPLDPFSYKHIHQPGDFEIERFKMEDLMVTMQEPGGFRPFSVSIFSCELPQLRKQWLFYDFLCANHVSGSFDGSLFTIHPRQVERVMPGVVDNSHNNINNPIIDQTSLESGLAWKKFSRLRIDGLKIDHLNRNDRGPFGWIYEGNVDIVADVMFPAEPEEGIGKVVSDFYDKMEEAVTSNRYIRILDGNYGRARPYSGEEGPELDVDENFRSGLGSQPGEGHLGWADPSIAESTAPAPILEGVQPSSPSSSPQATTESIPQYFLMDLRLHLNDIRAAVPFFPPSDSLGETRTQSYVNAQLIRPIVAYMNAKRTYIPISCRIVKHLSDFEGSWTLYDCALMDDMSAEVYAAFARDVEDQQQRVRRLKKVGFWTLSMVVHALLAGVAGDLM